MKSVATLVRPLVLIALLGACNPTSSVGSATPTTSTAASPTPTTATSAPIASPSRAPSTVTTGTITGRLGYPSDFVPPLTVYAISVSDSSVWFATDTPRFGNPLSATLPPGPTWPPTGPGTYAISGITPGSYYVIAYRNDGNVGVGVYTPWTAKCASSDPSVPSPPPGPCTADHSLLPVTVASRQTLSHIDIVDWSFQPGSYPSRPH